MNPNECPTDGCDAEPEEQAKVDDGDSLYSVRACYACGAEFRVRFLAVERQHVTRGDA